MSQTDPLLLLSLLEAGLNFQNVHQMTSQRIKLKWVTFNQGFFVIISDSLHDSVVAIYTCG